MLFTCGRAIGTKDLGIDGLRFFAFLKGHLTVHSE
jgi:hypothetical protein